MLLSDPSSPPGGDHLSRGGGPWPRVAVGTFHSAAVGPLDSSALRVFEDWRRAVGCIVYCRGETQPE